MESDERREVVDARVGLAVICNACGEDAEGMQAEAC